MKKLMMLTALVPCLCGAGELPDLGEPDRNWSNADIAREVAVVGLLLVDYGQTRDAQLYDHHETFQRREINPLLGKYPGSARIRNYFAAVTIGHIAITHYMPKEYRWMFQGATIAVEAYMVQRNARLGVNIKF